jgi:hypothetical protein
MFVAIMITIFLTAAGHEWGFRFVARPASIDGRIFLSTYPSEAFTTVPLMQRIRSTRTCHAQALQVKCTARKARRGSQEHSHVYDNVGRKAPRW